MSERKQETTISVNGKELDCDFLDVELFEKFDKANARVLEELSGPEFESLNATGKMRVQCQLVEDFFDEIFGEGTANDLFSGVRCHLGAHLDAYADVVEKALGASDRILECGERFSRSAAPNREARRAAARTARSPAQNSKTGTYRERLEKAERAAREKRDEQSDAAQNSKTALEEELEEYGLTREEFRELMKAVMGLTK